MQKELFKNLIPELLEKARKESKPENCVECPYSDHEAWCLLPGDWRIRYYLPDDCISESCPIWFQKKD